MIRKSKRLAINIPEACSIPALYDAVAEAANQRSAKIGYDCRKLLVSRDIYAAYADYMNGSGQGDAASALWLCYGPKVSDSLGESEVEIQNGFFVMEKGERD